jgi:hypothetical protein
MWKTRLMQQHRLILTSGTEYTISNEEQQKLVELFRQQGVPYRIVPVQTVGAETKAAVNVLIVLASIAAIEPQLPAA